MVNMRKAVLVTAILAGVILVQMVTVAANPQPHPFDPYIIIDSPQDYRSGSVYTETNIDITAEIRTFPENNELLAITSAFYNLDDAPSSILTLESINDTEGVVIGKLTNLTNGYHTLRVTVVDINGKQLRDSTTFLVDTTYSYPNFLVSPENITYSKNEVPLAFNSYSTLTIYYQIDSNTTSSGIKTNTTLTGLAEGEHKIIVTALSSSKIYSMTTVYFSVDTTSKEPNSVPELPATHDSLPVPTQIPEYPVTIALALALLLVTAFAVVLAFRRKS